MIVCKFILQVQLLLNPAVNSRYVLVRISSLQTYIGDNGSNSRSSYATFSAKKLLNQYKYPLVIVARKI